METEELYQPLSPRGDDDSKGPFNYAAHGYMPTGTRKRRSRFDPDLTPTEIPGFPKNIPPGLQKPQLDALAVRLRIEEITLKLSTGQFDVPMQDRPPSPDPIYDSSGKRVNTREQRAKDALTKERQKYVSEAMSMNPLFRPPADYVHSTQKKTKKIYIPVKEYPEYNFIGLIIGPRGKSQKRMVEASGANIAIRGKGAILPGKHSKGQYQDDDDLHVLLTADTDEQIARAEALIRELLIPLADSENKIKATQLKELAILNYGVAHEGPWNASQRTWDAAKVKCKNCGQISHPTQDCPLQNDKVPLVKEIDEEYESFLAEIGEKPTAVSTATLESNSLDTESTYKEFMAAINEVQTAPTHSRPSNNHALGFASAPIPWQQPFAFQRPDLSYVPVPHDPNMFPRGPGVHPWALNIHSHQPNSQASRLAYPAFANIQN